MLVKVLSRGKKLDFTIGSSFSDGWSEVTETKRVHSTQILLPKEHQLVFTREKRRGKVVTLVGRFSLSKEDNSALLKLLKKKLGVGGSYKEPWMEFQGELQDKLRELLTKEDYRFKR